MIGMRNRQQLAREAYGDRDETLCLLGFKNYGAYLRSALWKIVRERALEIHGRKCRRCDEPATQAHHGVYTREVLIGEDVRGLVPFCGSCHKAASLTPRGGKDRRLDRVRVRHLHDTNALLRPRVGPKPRRRVRERFWCPCGNNRKERHSHCRACIEKGLAG